MTKKILYAIGCAVGGACIGFFANQLNTIIGAIIFTVGVLLITFCTYQFTKRNQDEED